MDALLSSLAIGFLAVFGLTFLCHIIGKLACKFFYGKKCSWPMSFDEGYGFLLVVGFILFVLLTVGLTIEAVFEIGPFAR